MSSWLFSQYVLQRCQRQHYPLVSFQNIAKLGLLTELLKLKSNKTPYSHTWERSFLYYIFSPVLQKGMRSSGKFKSNKIWRKRATSLTYQEAVLCLSASVYCQVAREAVPFQEQFPAVQTCRHRQCWLLVPFYEPSLSLAWQKHLF